MAMNILSLNKKGIDGSFKRLTLDRLLETRKPNVFLLSKTMGEGERIKNMMKKNTEKLGFLNSQCCWKFWRSFDGMEKSILSSKFVSTCLRSLDWVPF
jgi:hypothetical protein